MAAPTPLHPDGALSLALAVVGSSTAPLVLLDGALNVVAASASFFTVFEIDPAGALGESFFSLGEGEWDLPRLRSLLTATLSGAADVDAYEMDLESDRLGGPRCLLLFQGFHLTNSSKPPAFAGGLLLLAAKKSGFTKKRCGDSTRK